MSPGRLGGSSPDARFADWLQTRPTPICWLVGPVGSGKSAAVRIALARNSSAVLLPLSAASPDRCFRQCLGVRTTKELFDKLNAAAASLVVLDALDTVQDRDKAYLGQISDLRLRHLLAFVARAKGPAVPIVVTSRLTPPHDLPPTSTTLVEFEGKPHPVEAQAAQPSDGLSVLEILASSRRAASDQLLGQLAGIPGYDGTTTVATAGNQPKGWFARLVGKGAASETSPVRLLLEPAIKDGVVHVVDLPGADWFQMSDQARARFTTEPRASAVHRALAEKLESEEIHRCAAQLQDKDQEIHRDLLERAIEHWLAAGDTKNAIRCYWQKMGSFAQLDVDNALHTGARACRMLVQGMPGATSESFEQTPGAIAVANDLATYNLCLGDASRAVVAAVAANNLPKDDIAPWDQSAVARHAAQAFLMRGELAEAMRWADEAKQLARFSLRKTEGVPTHEIVTAYEHASHEIVRIAAAGDDASGPAAVISDLVAAHAHWMRKLADFNRNSVVQVDAPTMEFDPERLLIGQTASLVAILDGKPEDAMRILSERLSSWSEETLDTRHALAPRMLLLRSQLAAGRFDNARTSLPSLYALAEAVDSTEAQCELAAAEADLAVRVGAPATALTIADEALILAESCDLALLRNELLGIRSKALQALGQKEDADAAAGSAKQVFPATVDRRSDWPRLSRSDVELRKSGKDRRLQLHERAMQAIEEYNSKGTPFVLYFRKYDFSIAHGPMEFGPRLTENVLYDAMPSGANLITIQDQKDSMAYTGTQFFADRVAPGLVLANDDWESVAKSLIASAELIVSEPYILSEAVRLELETALQANKEDKTVLLLPPQGSFFALVDNDPVIQKFPRCIWMDDFHNKLLVEMPQIRDLFDRLRKIASLPDKERSRTVGLAGANAFPVDLRPLAAHYEDSARWRSMQQDTQSMYYGFWELFRAGSIRGLHMRGGDTSIENRIALSDACLQMASVMLHADQEGDKIIISGDLDFAEQMVETAYALVGEDEGPSAVHLRARAEKLNGTVDMARTVLREQPERILLRQRFGPFAVRAERASEVLRRGQ